MHLSPKHNPYFRHARWQALIAWRGGTPVGRISAQVDTLHLERYADATGFFGMLDAEDRPDTFAALFAAAEQWLREQGMRRVRGPFSLSINEETGLLIEGFDTPPVFMMGHARPYYATHVEAQGYRKAVDTFAYRIAADFAPSPVMARLVAAAGEARAACARSTASASTPRSRSCGTSSTTPGRRTGGSCRSPTEEFHELGNNLRFLVDPGLIRIAEVDGEPAAFIVVIPERQRGDSRARRPPRSPRLGEAPVAAQGAPSGHRPRAADGRAAQVSAHAPRSCARVPRHRRRAAPDARPRRQGGRALVDPRGQCRHAEHHRVDRRPRLQALSRSTSGELDAR